jgi:hypothetical protein
MTHPTTQPSSSLLSCLRKLSAAHPGTNKHIYIHIYGSAFLSFLAEKQQTRIGRINREKKDSPFSFCWEEETRNTFSAVFSSTFSIEPDKTSV